MSNNQPRVLLVDDEPMNVKILADGLKEDYALSIATNGKEALRLAEDNKPDIILLDVMMPDMDGFEVCENLKSNPATEDIPVIFVTGLNDPISEEYGLDIGAADYIMKPASPSVVKLRLQLHLKQKIYNDFVHRLLTEDYADVVAIRNEARHLF